MIRARGWCRDLNLARTERVVGVVEADVDGRGGITIRLRSTDDEVMGLACDIGDARELQALLGERIRSYEERQDRDGKERKV